MKNLLCVLLPLFGITTEAQNVLTVEASLMRGSDDICMQRVTPLPVGDEGMDVQWDFTMAEDTGTHIILFRRDSLGHHIVIEDDNITKYSLSYDNLLQQTGMENRIMRMSYDNPKAVMRYPLQYGDTIS